MQEMRVQSLVWEDPTCQEAPRPVLHNYWACVPEPVLCSKRSHCREKPPRSNKDPAQPKINKIILKKKFLLKSFHLAHLVSDKQPKTLNPPTTFFKFKIMWHNSILMFEHPSSFHVDDALSNPLVVLQDFYILTKSRSLLKPSWEWVQQQAAVKYFLKKIRIHCIPMADSSWCLAETKTIL